MLKLVTVRCAEERYRRHRRVTYLAMPADTREDALRYPEFLNPQAETSGREI
jgi:hypothetical protein